MTAHSPPATSLPTDATAGPGNEQPLTPVLPTAIAATTSVENAGPVQVNLEVDDQPEFDGLWDKMRWDVSYTFTKLAVNNFQRWSKWTWFNRIDPVVILGALPDPRIIKILRDQEQLGGVINMCAEHPGEAQLCRSLNVPYLRLKTRDYTVPEFETIVNGVQWIEKLADQHLTAKLVPTADQQKPLPQPLSVYIHCKAGRGRSATIALCWLLYRYELTPEEAQALLLTKRPQVDRTLAAHPNVVRFYDEYCSPSTTSTSKPAPKRRPWVEAILVPSAPTPANPSDRVLVV